MRKGPAALGSRARPAPGREGLLNRRGCNCRRVPQGRLDVVLGVRVEAAERFGDQLSPDLAGDSGDEVTATAPGHDGSRISSARSLRREPARCGMTALT